MSWTPAISVLMTVYNRERLIGSAIQSILNQSFSDFEMVVVDDGSTDGTADVVRHFGDDRLRLLSQDANRGIPAGRNRALEAARGRYIAWLDSDDLARPDRLHRQFDCLEANPDLAMIGSCAGTLREDGSRRRGVRVPPFAHDDIRCWLLFRSAFQQSSIFGRASILKAYRYRKEFPVCEDVDMFVRLSRDHRVANLADVLIDRRVHTGQSIRNAKDPIADRQGAIAAPMLRALGLSFSPDDLRKHVSLGKADNPTDETYLHWTEDWLDRLLDANRASGIFHQSSLEFCSAFVWFRAVLNAHGGQKWRFAWSPLSRHLVGPHARSWAKAALPLMALASIGTER